jgi:hypothetical protein
LHPAMDKMSPIQPGTNTPVTSSRFWPGLIAGVLLVLGSVAFLNGGRHHPLITAALGPIGSEQFFHGFAQHVAMTPHWEAFHTWILIGPVLWALSAPAVEAFLPRGAPQIWLITRSAFGIGAVLWIIAFILDGYVAPIYAREIVSPTNPEIGRTALFMFKISALTMAKLGLVGLLLFGLSFAAYGVGLVSGARSAPWRMILGALGIVVGLWPMVAFAIGEFTPGPFTSPYWTATAIALGVWAALLGGTLIADGLRR